MSHPCALAGRATNYGPGVRLASSVAVDLGRTVGIHCHGPGDPTTIVTPTEAWLARRTPDGPATLRVTPTEAEAWGPGHDWMLAGVDDLLGADDRDVVVPVHPAVAHALRRFPGVRLSRSRHVMPALVAAILAQRVTSIEAGRALAHAGPPRRGPRLRIQPVAAW
jgi:hypothetical protein